MKNIIAFVLMFILSSLILLSQSLEPAPLKFKWNINDVIETEITSDKLDPGNNFILGWQWGAYARTIDLLNTNMVQLNWDTDKNPFDGYVRQECCKRSDKPLINTIMSFNEKPNENGVYLYQSQSFTFKPTIWLDRSNPNALFMSNNEANDGEHQIWGFLGRNSNLSSTANINTTSDRVRLRLNSNQTDLICNVNDDSEIRSNNNDANVLLYDSYIDLKCVLKDPNNSNAQSTSNIDYSNCSKYFFRLPYTEPKDEAMANDQTNYKTVSRPNPCPNATNYIWDYTKIYNKCYGFNDSKSDYFNKFNGSTLNLSINLRKTSNYYSTSKPVLKLKVKYTYNKIYYHYDKDRGKSNITVQDETKQDKDGNPFYIDFAYFPIKPSIDLDGDRGTVYEVTKDPTIPSSVFTITSDLLEENKDITLSCKFTLGDLKTGDNPVLPLYYSSASYMNELYSKMDKQNGDAFSKCSKLIYEDVDFKSIASMSIEVYYCGNEDIEID